MWSKAREAILESSEASSVYIGCDSLVHSKKIKGKVVWFADYSTVVVLHKDSRHGCTIFHNSKSLQDFNNLESRLLMEVQFALDAFENIKDVLGDRHVEVHLDVNPDPRHASNKVAAQALGWVKGMGIEARIKPEAFSASYAADHCVRRKSSFKTF